jgi:PIN domain nuclease of toxin-antitoxin system
MNILLDSHTLIWFSINSPRLSKEAINLLEDRQNQLFLSLVSVWEMQIKIQLGKLKLDLGLPKVIDDQIKQNDLRLLPIRLSHIWRLETLPHHHKDPFDRLLIAQAIVENFSILSVDDIFDRYRVERLWTNSKTNDRSI